MKGYRDALALIEAGRAFAVTDIETKRRRRSRKKKDPVLNLDELPVEVLMNKMDNYERKAKTIADYIEAKGKANKKEEKKEEKKGWEKLSFIQKFTVLTATVPLVMMTYSLLIIVFVKTAARAMGM